ncbi:MAG: DNA-binding protein [Campylobacteraceae bacterium]|nr:DNA-binding protein [Campylobacteraceae bacterium]
MEIAFKKVSKEGLDFSLARNKINFFGKIYQKSPTLALLEGKLEGELEHRCDRCAEDICLIVDEQVEMLISDGVYKTTKIDKQISQDTLAIVEIYDGLINFDGILQSEIESYKSDYHYCAICESQ